jgi:CRISPR-associated endonuclease/helicase Cas3
MSNSFKISIKPQYVKHTEVKERFSDGEEHYLHEVQKRMKLNFSDFPEMTIVTAPTGTGKSYAFPFPVLEAIKNRDFFQERENSIRGLIVLPTNALINELTENFRKTYPQLKINQLTGAELNTYDVKGFDRWEKALEICNNSDLVITNPDIINFAMHGGYHKNTWKNKTGTKEFHNFLEKFEYIIFDEYHLYDEAQIANILTLIKLRKLLLRFKSIKYFFVSATPEQGLKEIFNEENYDFEEIIEEIIDDPKNARIIHGMIEVEFIQSKDFKEITFEKIDEIKNELDNNRKVLLILNQLRVVQELSESLKNEMPNKVIYESTGYETKGIDTKLLVKNANIVVATNKAEVGVNYDVEYCIMQTGKHFQNFVQRFGRVSRGDLKGKVIVLIEETSTFNKLKRTFQEQNLVSYYDFLELIRPHFQERKFYTETVPFYVGEYMWCIQNNIRLNQEYETWQYLVRRMNEESFFKGKTFYRYNLLRQIDDIICEMVSNALYKSKISKSHLKESVKKLPEETRAKQWFNWWERYQNTYFTFRDGSKVVQIYDQHYKKELDYSLDWILQHKEIIKVETILKGKYEIMKYTVGSLKTQDKDLQYEVSTIPDIGAKKNSLVSYKEMHELQKFFYSAVEGILHKNRKSPDKINILQVQLCEKLEDLGKTFSRKRLTIESIETNEVFL